MRLGKDMRNYEGRGVCYLPKAEANNTNRGLDNFSYPGQRIVKERPDSINALFRRNAKNFLRNILAHAQ